MTKQRLRQAVVVIHGMGQQRPNDIMRAFVEAAIGDLDTQVDGEPIIFSRPDKVSDKYDARRYQALKTDQNTQTEFYEYHWAHHMQGNRLSHLWPLIKRLLTQRPWRIPHRLLPFWLLLVAVLSGGLAAVYYAFGQGKDVGNLEWLGALGLSGIALILLPQIFKIINYVLTRYLADVARYLDAAPGNQKVRNAIRKELIELLDDLHRSNRYSRIIVAAHSLGSFIAYDAIAYFWARQNKLHAIFPQPPDYAAIKELERAGGRLAKKERSLQQSGKSHDDIAHFTSLEREEFRDKQRLAWSEKRTHGNPWLITDLVTFGSPLAHAQILLEASSDKLQRWQNLYEIPRCPPVEEPFEHNRWQGDTWYSWKNEGEHRIIYHAAPFALVKWTNLWFARDWFAGPLAPNFGYGIKDIMLSGESLQTRTPLWSHTQYFSRTRSASLPRAITQLRQVLDLNADEWLAPTRNSPPADPTTQDFTGSR